MSYLNIRIRLFLALLIIFLQFGTSSIAQASTIVPEEQSQTYKPRTNIHTIEAINPHGMTILSSIEYSEGIRTPYRIELSRNYPEAENLEILSFDWEGTGTCAIVQEEDRQCTGTITYLKFAFRYDFPANYTGNFVTITLAAFDGNGSDFTSILEYPMSLQVVSTSKAPAAHTQGRVQWEDPAMFNFESDVVFQDPRITSNYLPLLKR